MYCRRVGLGAVGWQLELHSAGAPDVCTTITTDIFQCIYLSHFGRNVQLCTGFVGSCKVKNRHTTGFLAAHVMKLKELVVVVVVVQAMGICRVEPHICSVVNACSPMQLLHFMLLTVQDKHIGLPDLRILQGLLFLLVEGRRGRCVSSARGSISVVLLRCVP
jgi:hypothetical protein